MGFIAQKFAILDGSVIVVVVVALVAVIIAVVLVVVVVASIVIVVVITAAVILTEKDPVTKLKIDNIAFLITVINYIIAIQEKIVVLIFPNITHQDHYGMHAHNHLVWKQ